MRWLSSSLRREHCRIDDLNVLLLLDCRELGGIRNVKQDLIPVEEQAHVKRLSQIETALRRCDSRLSIMQLRWNNQSLVKSKLIRWQITEMGNCYWPWTQTAFKLFFLNDSWKRVPQLKISIHLKSATTSSWNSLFFSLMRWGTGQRFRNAFFASSHIHKLIQIMGSTCSIASLPAYLFSASNQSKLNLDLYFLRHYFLPSPLSLSLSFSCEYHWFYRFTSHGFVSCPSLSEFCIPNPCSLPFIFLYIL